MSSLSTNLLGLIYAAFIVVEYWLHRPARPENYGLKNAAINVTLGTLSGLSDLFVIGFYFVFYRKMEPFALIHLDYSWKYWLLLFLGHDLLYYTMHVCEHKIRLFWAVHFTHHSCREMNLTVAIRSSIFQPFYRYGFYLPLIFVGFHGADIFLMWLIANTWVSYVHTEAVGKLGFLETFLVTPAVHRVHHSSREEHLDKNFGIVLSIWDRLFGTFSVEKEDKTAQPYGLTTQHDDFNFKESMTYEWQRLGHDLAATPSIRGKMRLLFGPPKAKPLD